ncbi:MAG: V-type ATP synthase subunit I [Candidatus Rhabdochlamydia sp.]
MIKDVLKYLIYGTQRDLDQFLIEAQNQGFLEFISSDPQKKLEIPSSLEQLSRAIKILKTFSLEGSFQEEVDPSFALHVAEDVIDFKSKLEKLEEEKKNLEDEKIRVAPLGHFFKEDLIEIEKRGDRKIQFFCAKISNRLKIEETDQLFWIATENDLDYFLSITKEGISPLEMIEMRVDLSAEEIQNQLDLITDQITHLEHELKKCVPYVDLMAQTLVAELNEYHLSAAKKNVMYPLKAHLFFSKVWIPSHRIEELFKLMKTLDIHAEQIALDPYDKVPTYLENQGVDLIGEDLIKIYDTPSIQDKDPSRWVLGFFALFFAMIVGDGGYGALFLACTLYIQKKIRTPSEMSNRMIKLVKILSVSCIMWGVMTASYFGIQLSPAHPLMKVAPIQRLVVKKADFHLHQRDGVYQSWQKKFPLIEKAASGIQMLEEASTVQKGGRSYPMANEFFGNVILELSLLLGIIHLSLSMMRNIRRHIAGFGWSLLMFGGYFFFPTLLGATTLCQFTGLLSSSVATTVGIECIGVGMGFAVVAAVIQHKMKGMGEALHVVQIIADVLSYLRLYALSLAGAIMASTFNREGSSLGVVLGFIILIAGHSVNITLALMGGVIHGLRLNFLEWYRYSFEGNGKLFNPLHKLKTKG